MKVERQLKRKGIARYLLGSSSSSPSWKFKWDDNRGDETVSSSKVKTPRENEEVASKITYKTDFQPS